MSQGFEKFADVTLIVEVRFCGPLAQLRCCIKCTFQGYRYQIALTEHTTYAIILRLNLHADLALYFIL